MTIERYNYEVADQAAIAESEAVTAVQATEYSVVERGVRAAKDALRMAGDIGKIVINGDLSETLRQSTSHLS